MKILKHALIILFTILLSFLLSSSSLPPDKSESSFTLSMDIPSEHKIKIITYGHGSILFENTQKNNEDIINCKRFSDATFSIIPDDNYETDKLTFNDIDMKSTLNLNTITLHNITEDGTLIISFKIKSSTNTTSFIKSDSSKVFMKTVTNFSKSIATGDSDYLVLPVILLLSTFYIMYRIYKALNNKNIM